MLLKTNRRSPSLTNLTKQDGHEKTEKITDSVRNRKQELSSCCDGRPRQSKVGRKVRACCAPYRAGSWVSIQHNVAWAEDYLGTKWYPDSSSRLATIDMGRGLYGRRLVCVRKPRKWGGLLCPFRLGELGPHLTQCGLGRGLSPYQVAS